MAVFELLEPSKLIARKILSAEKTEMSTLLYRGRRREGN